MFKEEIKKKESNLKNATVFQANLYFENYQEKVIKYKGGSNQNKRIFKIQKSIKQNTKYQNSSSLYKKDIINS